MTAAVIPMNAAATIAQKLASGEHPDAALINTGKTFDTLVAAYHEAVRDWSGEWEAFSEAVGNLMAEAKAGKLKTISGTTLFDLASHRAEQIAPRPSSIHPDDFIAFLDPIQREILSRPARTPAGLAVKCRVAKFSLSDLWSPETSVADLDWDKFVMRELVEFVLAYVALSTEGGGGA